MWDNYEESRKNVNYALQKYWPENIRELYKKSPFFQTRQQTLSEIKKNYFFTWKKLTFWLFKGYFKNALQILRMIYTLRILY